MQSQHDTCNMYTQYYIDTSTFRQAAIVKPISKPRSNGELNFAMDFFFISNQTQSRQGQAQDFDMELWG